MTNPTAAPSDSSAAAPAPDDQALTDAGRQLAFAVAAESDDPKAVDAEMSKALDTAGADNFGAVAGHAAVVLATEILSPLLAKADAAGMHRLRTDLMVAAAAAAPDSSSTDNGPAVA